ncbi:MAG: peptidoglycan editing factor PgeF [Paracoccaceae bacterium]
MSLEILTSDALSAHPHGFFTRKGGASSGVFSGLNCGLGSSDQTEIVQINRARAAQALDLEPDKLQSVHQVHSADVVTLTSVTADAPKADALVTATPGAGLAILTADCQPVLLADTQAGVIGAAHAGWRGARDGILHATVAAMENLGAKADNIHAVIGPSISQKAYEVGPEFFEEFLDEDPENARYFAGGSGDRLHFDLPAYGLARLRDAGVGRAEWTRHCTYSDPDRFFSYRRSVHEKEADYGRLISIITL